MKFKIKTVDRPGVVAMELGGAYTAEGLRFERAVSELRRRQAGPSPFRCSANARVDRGLRRKLSTHPCLISGLVPLDGRSR